MKGKVEDKDNQHTTVWTTVEYKKTLRRKIKRNKNPNSLTIIGQKFKSLRKRRLILYDNSGRSLK